MRALGKASLLVVLAFLTGLLPFHLGLLLGFGAFVITPVAMVGLLVALGVAISFFWKGRRWIPVVLAAIVVGSTAVLYTFVIELMISTVGDTPFPFVSILVAICLCMPFLVFGTWLAATIRQS